jgi:hypothetical protein
MARIKISVVTHKNGYELNVNDSSFFYFTADDLLAGLTCHVIDGSLRPAVVRDAKLKMRRPPEPLPVTDADDIQGELKQLDANDKYKTPRRVRERNVVRYHKNRDHILQLRRENYKRKKLNNEQ